MTLTEFQIYFTYMERDLLRSFNLAKKVYLSQFEDEEDLIPYIELLNYEFKK